MIRPVRLRGPAIQLVGQVVRDTITDCPDVDPFIMGDSRLLGDAHLAQNSLRHEFWAAYFEPDPEERARFKRVLAAPSIAFRDLARLVHAETGVVPSYPPALLELFRQRLALAYFPSAGVVANRARTGAALYAQKCLARYIEVDEWLKRS